MLQQPPQGWAPPREGPGWEELPMEVPGMVGAVEEEEDEEEGGEDEPGSEEEGEIVL